MAPRRAPLTPRFSLFVLAVLFIQLFAPTAYAQAQTAVPPAPTPPTAPSQTVSPFLPGQAFSSPACRIAAAPPAETSQLWRMVQNFQAQELNSLTPGQLARNTQLGQPPAVQVIVAPGEGAFVQPSVRDVARVIAAEPKDLADRYGVPIDGTLSESQLRDVLSRNPGKSSQLASFFSREKTGETKTETRADRVVHKLASGVEIKESDLEKLAKIDPDNCALANAHFSAPASYLGLATTDFAFGADRGVTAPSTSSHLTASRVFGALNLNGGSNIVVPDLLMTWLKAFKKINYYDMYANAVLSTFTLARAATLSKPAASAQQTAALVDEARNARLAIQEAEQAAEAARRAAADPVLSEQARAQAQLAADAAERQAAAARNNLDEVFKTLEKNPRGAARELNDMQELARRSAARATTGLAMGMFWLGPARYAYTINTRLFFDSAAATAYGRAGTDARNDFFLRVYAGNEKEVAQQFRESTNFLGTGTFQEFASETIGISAPAEAFHAGPLYVFNAPEEARATTGTTSVDLAARGWRVSSQWRGGADAYATEKLRENGKWERLNLETNGLHPDTVIDRRETFRNIYAAGLVALPFIITRDLQTIAVTAPVRAIAFLTVTEIVAQIDHQAFRDSECDPDVLDEFITAYAAATVVASTTALLPYITPIATAWTASLKGTLGLLHAASAGRTASYINSGLRALDTLSLPLAYQYYVGSRAQEYVSACKDNKYLILAHRSVANQTTSSSSTLRDRLPSLDAETGLNRLLNRTLNRVLEKELQEPLNLRVTLANQRGSVELSELYYVHLKGGSQQAVGVFDDLEKRACFRHMLQGGDKTIGLDANGITQYDRNGNRVASLDSPEWRQRALLSLARQDLARTLVPNKLISFPLACGAAGTVLELDGFGNADYGNCPEATCLRSALESLAGRSISRPSDPLGRVQALWTTEFRATVRDGVIYATQVERPTQAQRVEAAARPAPSASWWDDTKELGRLARDTILQTSRAEPVEETTFGPGWELQSPFQGAPESEIGKGALLVRGDGSVQLTQPSGRGNRVIGEVRTIVFENGRLEYEPSTKTVHVVLYTVAALPAGSVLGVDASPVKNPDGSNAVKINNVATKAGFEEAGTAFNAALQKLQEQGGFQYLETDNYSYFFTKNAQGQDVLQICDKRTGQCRDVRVTSMHREGNDLVVRTPEGDYRFNVSAGPDGRPLLHVTGPGFEDLANLLAARSPAGIIVFNPDTGRWEILNGQDIPWNRQFADNGLSYYGTPDGNVKGVPAPDLLTRSRARETDAGNPLLALPTAPQPNTPANAALLLLFITSLAAGVLAVRYRRA